MWSLLRPAEAPLATRARRRWDLLKRDIAMVFGGPPSPLVARRPTPQPPAVRGTAAEPPAVRGTAAAARPMVVRAIRRETADATTVVLGDAAMQEVAFVPGQFLTLLVTIDGETHRRAYSICEGGGGEVAITAKRIAGGRVSTYLHERLRVGDVIPVLGPSGEFTVAPDPAASRELVLIAGGSGITPIIAIARAVLATEPHSKVALVFGNRRPDDIIFRAALDELAARHRDRMTIRHVLEEPGDLAATRGRLDRAIVEAELDAIGEGAGADYYVCGPAAAMAAAVEALTARGVPPARIHQERFATAERVARARTVQPLTIRTQRGDVSALVAPDASILDAGLAAGIAMPFSCAMGGCGACAVDLVDGDVDLDEPNCLLPDERARGRILACVARPTGPCTVVVP